MPSVTEAVFRLRRVPPRRLPVAVGRYALRTARTRARRWRLARTRGELSDTALRQALGGLDSELAFRRFLSRFFVDPAEARRRADTIAQHHPHLAHRTLATAEQVLEHVFDLLGSGPVRLAPDIDWHTDFRSGIAWPRDLLGEDHDSLRLGEPCDVKIVWELNRCHHWVTLGRAYALQSDPRYVQEFISQLEAWLDDNPWPYGINWSRAMEVAVRAINWMWAAALFAEAPEFSAQHRHRLLKALLQHARYVRDNLEYSDNNGNHYLSNGVGLLFFGIVLADFREAAGWLHKGQEIVWGELQRQVHPDGVDFEQAIGYHGLVLEFWYSCLLLCERQQVAVPSGVRPILTRMFDFVQAYTRPDGSFPQVGDNDDGRLAGLDDEPVGSHRRHLAVGGALLGRADLLAAAGDAVETAVWLCGPSVLEAPREARDPPSRAFAESGFYVLRSADAHMLVDVGEVGMRGIGGHGHNDVLSFDLWAAGAPLLVDSGTYSYTLDAAARRAMRSIAAHNALRIDGEETSRLAGGRWLWLIHNDAHPQVLEWASDATRDILEASHDGYRRLPEPVLHRRRIVFDKVRSIWRIDDILDGRGQHLVELFFHPAVPFDLYGHAADNVVYEDADNDVSSATAAVRLRAPHADVWLFPPPGMRLQSTPGWISRGYGQRAPATVLVYATRCQVPARFTSRLLRVSRDTPADVVRLQVERAS